MSVIASRPAARPSPPVTEVRGASTTNPRRRRLGPGKRIPFARLTGPLLILGLWSLLSVTGFIDERQMPAPWTVFEAAKTLFEEGRLQTDLEASLYRALVGLAFGLTVGTVLAVIAGTSRFGDALIDGPVQIKRAVPTLGLIPLLILWFGIGETFKVVVIATSVAVPVYINTHAGLSGIDSKLVELSETVGLSRWNFIRSIVFPGSLPGFFVGLRLAVTMSWTALVVVEQVNAISGIGYMMQRAQEYGQTAIVVVGLSFYAVFGFVSDAAVRMLERRTLRWRRTLSS